MPNELAPTVANGAVRELQTSDLTSFRAI